MFDDPIEELRYPFESVFEFVSGGYYSELEALHLTLGFIFIVWLCGRVVLSDRHPLPSRFSALYFGLALFTNPAYDVGGLKFNELLGVFAVLLCFVLPRQHVPKLSAASPVARAIGLVFILGLLQNLCLAFIYPQLNADLATLATRMAVNFKVLVLAANLVIMGNAVRQAGPGFIVKAVVACGTFGLLMYMLQVAMILTGRFPYGTYIDAGYIGIPSFGSVSIERGHFGKFMAPLYPFFTYALLAYGWRWRFFLLVIVTAINFSASSQVFFVCFCLLALFRYRSQLLSPRALLPATVLLVGAIGLVAYLPDVFLGMANKIYELAIQGDEHSGGGRSFGVFSEYMSTYPLGIGYGGSTLRTAPGLPEINAAHFAFITQYSLVALPIALGYLVLVIRTLKAARRMKGNALVKAMSLGVLMSAVIFLIDILWFIPTIWLAFELIWSESASTKVLPRVSQSVRPASFQARRATL